MTFTVLVVEDSLTVRMDLKEILEEAGYGVTACATAGEARQALAGEAFDLVLMDVLLPDGNGVDLLKGLRSQPSTMELPVLLLSSEAEVQDRIRGVKMGADDYVGKPYDRASLLARVRDLLWRRGTEARSSPLVLVVDDSRSFREAMRMALEDAGYAVLLAADGEEGLSLAAAARPDAVLVDGSLPGIDGATLIQRMRMDVALRQTPCLLLTASGMPDYEITALEAGADTFLHKTEDTSIILARLSAMLRVTAPCVASGPVQSLFGPKRVLAVDDSLTFLHELAEQIRAEGYDIILASSGQQALELLEVQGVDCILLDLIMPGLSGEETCRRIKGSPGWRDIPLVMLTAQEGRETMIQAFEVGADDYIPKSSDFEVIKARLRAQLRRKHFEDENRRIREELLQKEREASEARVAKEIAQTRAMLLSAMENANRELEAFAHTVSHDLRAPLRAIDGFSALIESGYADRLDEKGLGYFRHVREATQRMAQLIEDLLRLSRIARSELVWGTVDLSQQAKEIAEELQRAQPDRKVAFRITPGLEAKGDRRLLRVALDNLLGNAWKYTSRRLEARIEFGLIPGGNLPIYFVKDDGAGFDMAQADKLFRPFQRLHSREAFEGTGIGLATVQRIIHRHGGRIWPEADVDRGATFFFTLQTLA
jgi:DNA-binding response OmpR family regulator